MKAEVSKYPFVFLTFFLALGILLAPHVVWLPIVGAIGVLFFYLNKPKNIHLFLSAVLVFCLGSLSYWFNWENRDVVKLEGNIENVFSKMEVDGLSKTAKKLKVSAKVLASDYEQIVQKKVFIYTDKDAVFEIGDVFTVRGDLIKFQKPTIPDQFDFEEYYNSHGYLAQLFVSKNELNKVGHHLSFNYYVEQLRNHLRGNLEQLISNVEERAIIKALVVGDRQELSRELKTVYVTAGIFHVLAVSGLHVGMMYMIILFMTRFIPNNHVKFIVLITCLFFYACLTGLSTSVIRASVMFGFFGFAAIYQRRTSSINILFASCFLILVFKPNFIFESGFQLSVSAVLGILLFFRKIEAWFVFKYKIFNKIWSLAAVSIAAQILTTPLILYYFHQFPSYFILINVVVVLMIQFALIFGCLAAGLGEFFGVGTLFAKVSECICWLINQMATMVSHWPMSRVVGVHLEMEQVFFLTCTILCVYWLITFRKRLSFYVSFLLLAGFVSVSAKRYLAYSQQDYLAFHKIKGALLIEKVSGKNSTLYYDKQRLEEQEIRLTLGNYWAKRNISVQDLETLKTVLTVGGESFVINEDLPSDYYVRMSKWAFEIKNKEGELVFDSDFENSLVND